MPKAQNPLNVSRRTKLEAGLKTCRSAKSKLGMINIMKKTRPIAGQDEFKRYAREKVKQLWDEVVELIFCSLLSSHLMD
ncbi:MAG: hypothetical protein DKINENOH_01720 [bacterium]|nr:hypothetical protein [bacterium]